MLSLFRIPKVQLTLILLIIFLSALITGVSSAHISLLFICVGFTVFFDLLFIFLRRKRLFIPHAAIATGLIITLIVDPGISWYQISVISAFAMGTKNFLKISGRHIFNPAAIGLFIGGILFHQYVSWWGTSFQAFTSNFSFQKLILFLILLLPVLISGIRQRRYTTILIFLASYTLLAHVFTYNFSIQSLIGRLLDPTVIFFATTMLPEPMTSPVNTKRQALYGFTVAFAFFILSYPVISKFLFMNNLLPDLFIPALLLGNVLFFKYR